MYFNLWITDKIASGFVSCFRWLMFSISSLCYELVIFFYDIFVRLGTAEILTTSQIEKIYSRVTLILGMFMLFKLAFSFVQYLLNPETMSDKSKGAGKIIMKAIIVVVLLGTTPFIFRQAFNLQKAILDSNILGKVILGTNNADSDVSNFGSDLSSYMFFSFYSFYEGETCEYGDIDDMKDEVKLNHTFELAEECLNEKGSSEKYSVNFAGNGVLTLVVGIFVLYIILSYCLSVGMRVIQLAFLQLIAPIPILSYIGEDKEGAFSKWVKRCISTFLDLFIRIAIIYFIVYIINLLMSDSDSYYWLLASTGNPVGKTKFWLIIVIIIGLLLFAKKAPDLLKEVLPQGIGNNIGFGLNFGKDMKTARESLSPMSRVAGLGAGAIVGGTMSGLSRFNSNRNAGNGLIKSLGAGAIGAVTGGVATGIRATKKGNIVRNVRDAYGKRVVEDDRYTMMINEGGTTIGKWATRARGAVTETKAQVARRVSRENTEYSKFLSNVKNQANNADWVDKLQKEYETIRSSGDVNKAKAAETRMKQARKGFVTLSNLQMNGIDIQKATDFVTRTDSNGNFLSATYKYNGRTYTTSDETVKFAYDYTHDNGVNHIDSSDTQYIEAIKLETKMRNSDAANLQSLSSNPDINKNAITYNDIQNSVSAAGIAASEVIPEDIRKYEAEDRAAQVRDRFGGHGGHHKL